MNNEILYTQEQLELALLKQRQDSFSEEMRGFKEELREMSNSAKNQFYWIMGSTSALYFALIGTLVTALAKSLSWF